MVAKPCGENAVALSRVGTVARCTMGIVNEDWGGVQSRSRQLEEAQNLHPGLQSLLREASIHGTQGTQVADGSPRAARARSTPLAPGRAMARVSRGSPSERAVAHAESKIGGCDGCPARRVRAGSGVRCSGP